MRSPILCSCYIILLVTGPTLSAQSGDPGECYQKFNGSFQGVKNALAARYGRAWHTESLPSEISGELIALQSADTQLRRKAQDLRSQRSGLNWDENSLETKTKAFEARNNSVDERMRQIDEELTELHRKDADLSSRIAIHNGNLCVFPPGHPEECSAYEREKSMLEAERDELARRVKSLEQRQENLEGQKQQLGSEASGLAELDTTLAQRKQSLTNDEASFVGICIDATTRADALVEVIGSDDRSTHATEKESDKSADVFKPLGQDVVVKAFEYVSHDSPYAGIALTAADMIHADMDARTKEITNNIYLLRDYAVALRRLKREGRLSAGEPGYNALQAMTRRLGQGMPSSIGTFTLESLANTRTLLDTALVSLASHYGARKSEHIKNEIFSHLSPEQKRVLGKNALRFFQGASSVVVRSGASVTPEAFFRDGAEELSRRRAKLAEAELQQ
jgi:predicted  nucleic acid-binding Zn-ribbon protein